jgi:hypothetical protein
MTALSKPFFRLVLPLIWLIADGLNADCLFSKIFYPPHPGALAEI